MVENYNSSPCPNIPNSPSTSFSNDNIVHKNEELSYNQDVLLGSLTNEPFPSDKGHFLNIELNDKLKMFIPRTLST